MKKALIDNKIVYYLFLVALVAIALLAAIFIKKYMGYAGTLSSEPPGTITTTLIDDRRQTMMWHGLFGLAFTESGFNETQSASLAAGTVSSKIFVFECIDPFNTNQEIYASLNNSINFTNLTAGSTSMIDGSFMNYTNDTFSFETAANAFLYNTSFLLGTRNISNVPAAFTYVRDAVDGNFTFYTGILNDSGRLAFVIKINVPSTSSFKNSNVHFQALLPVNNQTRTYYFFADPNDVCPENLGIGIIGTAYIAGYVLEINSTVPIFNATVAAAGNRTYTDAAGFYNFSVPGGHAYELVAMKEEYLLNITRINTSIGNTTLQNLTLARFYGYRGINGTITGHLSNNETGAIISQGVVHIDGTSIAVTSSNYSLNVSQGTHVIAAIADGYINFIGNFTLAASQNLSYIVNMTRAKLGIAVNGTEFFNGTVAGFVLDNDTGSVLQNALVTVNGVTNLSDSTGAYSIYTYEGPTNLVATRTGYEAFYSNITILENNITALNFSMEPLVIIPSLQNGSVNGVVRDSGGSALSGVFVSVAGISNLSMGNGSYFLNNTVPGTHNIIATKTGYQNYYAEIVVYQNNATVHNIVMTTRDDSGLGPGQGSGLGAGQGAGQGPGQGPGRGPGTAIEPQVEEPREIPDYKISVKEIIKKIEEGNYITFPITFSNFLKDTIGLSLEIEGSVAPLVRLETEQLVVDAESQQEVLITILGNREPGIYDGAIIINGDIEDKIPLYVLVKQRDRLDVENIVLKIIPDSRVGVLGKRFRYRLDIQNLLADKQYPINLTYKLEGIQNNVSIHIEQESFDILTSFTVIKSFVIPKNIPKGDYRLIITARYLGITSDYATIFSARQPWYKYTIFELVPVGGILILLILLGLIVAAIWWYKKKSDDKKRYHIDLDYTQLPKQGPRSAYVGLIAETAKRTYFDLDQMQTHTLVAGSTGSGKSVAAQCIVEEALMKGTAVMVFDPTVQWTGFLGRCQDKKFLELYPKFGFRKSDARSFNGNIHQILDAREVIEFNRYIKPSEINVFVVNRLETRDYEIFVSNVIKQVFHNNMPESKQLRLVLVFDEFHRLLPKYGGTGQVLIQIERAAREFRKWGVGLVLISQVISDFQAEVLANINTQIQMRTKDEGDLKRTADEYGERYLKSLVKAAVGAGMIENSSYNKGKPYFVAFRPLLHNIGRISDADLENYNKYNRIIDDLEYQLEQLEKFGIDIFDLQLELKLALDKVKAGSFNMVDIYLEGLKPRIKQQWEKIGKEPKKKEIKYDQELGGELEKAKIKQDEKTAADKVDANNDAMAKAKAAKAEAKNLIEMETKKPDEQPNSIELILKKIQETLDKSVLVNYYKQLQIQYKSASKEEKVKILNACNLIKTKLG